MSTPTPRTKPIDLSKCKVGQRVKLRNGKEVSLISKHDPAYAYPYVTNDGHTHLKNGLVWKGQKDPFDIIAILPLPKKAGKKKVKEPMVDVSQDNLRAAIKHAEATLNYLKGLLKP